MGSFPETYNDPKTVVGGYQNPIFKAQSTVILSTNLDSRQVSHQSTMLSNVYSQVN